VNAFRLLFIAILPAVIGAAPQDRQVFPWATYKGAAGPGKGKHIVLISGDEEYRSEETLPQLAKILARHHGFTCTVLFAVDPKTGTIDPNYNSNIPGLEALQSADLMILATRYRNLPDNEMKYIADYVESGKPIVGMRTATHAFNLKGLSKFARFSVTSKEWPGGFGRHVLGETWVDHHGHHGKESTRGILAPGEENHPILRGIKDGDIFGPTDVYTVRLPLAKGCTPLVLGQVLEGMKPTDRPVAGIKNNPMMPIAWTRLHKTSSGATARVFTTTMGASQDLLSEGFRRLLANACYWTLGMEDRIAPHSNVAIVGEYVPTPFRFNGYQKGRRPADLEKD
jgi:hypothetical protein